jgi:hypothetical protein
MEIHRQAARRPGAEARVVVPEREPELLWDQASGRLILRALDTPSWKGDNAHYDYLEDIERIRQAVARAASAT